MLVRRTLYSISLVHGFAIATGGTHSGLNANLHSISSVSAAMRYSPLLCSRRDAATATVKKGNKRANRKPDVVTTTASTAKITPKKSKKSKSVSRTEVSEAPAPKKRNSKKKADEKPTTKELCVFPDWKWRDGRSFTSFDDATCKQIEEAYQQSKGTGSISLTYNNHTYNIDFDNMEQENSFTGKRRSLKREWKEEKRSVNSVKDRSRARFGGREIKKGDGVVDRFSGKASTCHVYQDSQAVYQCTLNQTNVVANKNKFYIVQLLEEDACKGKFYLFSRWGRVGTPGETMTEPFATLSAAVGAFEKKFKSKTGNKWVKRDEFKHISGKYHMMKIDSDDIEEDQTFGKKTEETNKVASVLHPVVQDLMRMIGDKDAMNRSLRDMSIDVKRMPLGKISKPQIKEAYEELAKIEKLLTKKNSNSNDQSAEVQESTDLFYTLIPHYFGFSRPPLIDTLERVKEKREMLDTLAEMEIANALLKENETKKKKEDPGKEKHELDRLYDSLQCQIIPVDKESDVHKRIELYVANTQGKTHHNKLRVEQVFEVSREGEMERYMKHHKQTPNKQMLWHGSRTTNFIGILSKGLRIAPPEAPSTGYMFGKGVYFADVCSKSANYCHVDRRLQSGLMLLCEVALGKQKEFTNAHYVKSLEKGYHSVKGVGSMYPNPEEYIESEGLKWPLGKLCDQRSKSGSLYYPEHIIYDVNQCCMRYLIKMKFD